MTGGQNRTQIKTGQNVSIVLKKDQRTGVLTQGVVKNILTKSSFHPHGIKVRLENGLVGRVKVIHG
nr:YwbE family protein [uncultured Desulfobacter sp.]